MLTRLMKKQQDSISVEMLQQKYEIIKDAVEISLQKMKNSMRKYQINEFFDYLVNQIDQKYSFHLCKIPSKYLPFIQKSIEEKYGLEIQYKSEQKYRLLNINPPTLIAHISFPNLKQLILEGNMINNIEALIYLDAPCLEEINISNNQIVNLNILSKANFPVLRKLQLQCNKLSQIGNFYRIHANNLEGKFFNYRYFYQSYQYEDIIDFRFIFKLQTPLQNIYPKRHQINLNLRNKQYTKRLINQPAVILHLGQKKLRIQPISRMSAPVTTGCFYKCTVKY